MLDLEIVCIGQPISVEYAIQRARECHTFGASIEACAKAAHLDLDKQVCGPLGLDGAQLSRWQSGSDGIKWGKLDKIRRLCGNDIPIYWILIQAGYEPHSLRLAESEVERRARHEREEAARRDAEKDARIRELEIRNSTLLEAFRGRAA